MGFLKSAMKGAIKNAVSPDKAKSILGNTAKNAGTKFLDRTADKAAVVAANATVAAAANALSGGSRKKSNPLQTPPPPAIPSPHESLSVMVAVNGQTYGPYERPALQEMIANGTLTRETYVFIQGMAGWTAAAQVPQVAALFGTQTPPPPAPPAPWANAAPAASAAPAAQTNNYNNTFSDKLNSLITAAVADGEINDMERQVLIRNAQEEGVSMDEFVMVLEARLYEQQQVIMRQRQEEARKNQVAQAQMNASAPAPAAPKLSKCPHCGAPVNSLYTNCPECGLEYPTGGQSYDTSAWEALVNKLEAIDNKYNSGEQKKSSLLGNMFGAVDALKGQQNKTQAKVQAINNHPIPTSKHVLVDFFTMCAPQAKSKSFFELAQEGPEGKLLSKAYKKKAEQVLIKARIVLKNDPELLNQIEALAIEYKINA